MSDQNSTRDPYNEAEREAMDKILAAYNAVLDLDPRGRLWMNTGELAPAVHVLQSFVVQHMNHRHWPEEFSDWYRPEAAD